MEYFSEDPIGFNAGDANLYRYVGNSPTKKIDPDGLEEQDLDAWREELRKAYEQALRDAAAQQPAEPPITRVPGVFGNSVHLNDGYFAGSPFGIPTVVCHGVTGSGRVGPPNSFRFPGGPGQLQYYQALRDTTASGVAGVGLAGTGYFTLSAMTAAAPAYTLNFSGQFVGLSRNALSQMLTRSSIGGRNVPVIHQLFRSGSQEITAKTLALFQRGCGVIPQSLTRGDLIVYHELARRTIEAQLDPGVQQGRIRLIEWLLKNNIVK